MATWRRHMPIGMFLKSTPSASAISAPARGFTLLDFCAESGLARLDESQAVPIDLFERYGLWFQERLVPWVEQERVRQIRPVGGAFDVTLESGEHLRAGSVVVATGLMNFAHIPGELSAFDAGGAPACERVSHSSHHRDLSAFAGRRVAVIGAGQSALESAALLKEGGADVHVLVRGPRVLFAMPPTDEGLFQRLVKPSSPMGPGWSLLCLTRGAPMFRHLPPRARLRTVRSVLGPSGAWWLRERIDGGVDIRTEHRVRAVTLGDGAAVVHVNDANRRGYQLPVDHVIAATGYRVDLGALGFLAPDLRDRLCRVGESPQLTSSFESSLPGLYFVGLAGAATFGPLLRFVCGTELAARRVSTAVASRSQSRAWN
jgi:thioredoxin reductase